MNDVSGGLDNSFLDKCGALIGQIGCVYVDVCYCYMHGSHNGQTNSRRRGMTSDAIRIQDLENVNIFMSVCMDLTTN